MAVRDRPARWRSERVKGKISIMPDSPLSASSSGPIRIDLAERSYEIHVGAGLLEEVGERLRPLVRGRRALIAVDNEVPPPLATRVEQSLAGAGFGVVRCFVAAMESKKTVAATEEILRSLVGNRFDRSDVVVALGGGLTGDVAGFAASIYRRGVSFANCPTTLLAMVDASVGGKTGVNAKVEGNLLKNMIGTFWQPVLVLADPVALDSLPDRELRCGLAECLKHGLIAGAASALSLDSADEHLRFVEQAAKAILSRDAGRLADLVRRNVAIKAAFVTADEREDLERVDGGRAMLNLGHTFAHAFEPLPNVSPTTHPGDAPLRHGEAVALGLIAAAETSRAIGRLTDADAERVREDVKACGLPHRVAGLPSDETLLTAMSHDKKSVGDAMRLVLPDGLGRASVVEDPPTDAVRAGLAAIRTDA